MKKLLLLFSFLLSLGISAEDSFIDLGLPSGLLWATCNLGASVPEDAGNYYAWGETSPKTFFSEDNYIYKDFPIGLTDISGTEYDAATVALGGTWRMPTKEEIKELTENCTRTQTTRNGKFCMELTGPNGNKLIVARGGLGEQGTTHEDGYGLWSSTKKGSTTAFRAWEWTIISYSFTWQGIPIRPVTSQKPTDTSYDIAINEENFPDENFRTFLKEQPYGEDDILTDEEINSITTINVRNKNIKSLEGIEFFTALDSFVCNFNQLTSLDVSRCTALTSLDCRHNQLTSLDLSKNTALKSLGCNYNKLANLDVSKNTALTKLHCCSNQLTNLDMSNNTALTSFDCRGNLLTSLDVSNNMVLKELWCNGNQLTSLDVSKNTALTEFECTDNQLTSLDVTKNAKLIHLQCYKNQLQSLDVSRCSVLASLNCNDNQLTSLDVSGCTVLTSLSCNNNLLTSLDMSGCTVLTSLNCNDNQLTSLDVTKNAKLIHLQCYKNQLQSLDVSRCSVLASLNCNDNQLTSLDVSGCTVLTSLSCNNNLLTSLDMSGCTVLTSLNCNDNQLISLDVSKNTALTSLYCYENQIKGIKMDTLVSTLPIQNQAQLYIINPSSAQEGNICTKDQVKIARKRGWRVYKSTGGYYEGSESEEHIIIKINEENFPDENFRAFLKEQWYGQDSILTEKTINSITTINVRHKYIKSLEGIEYFTALVNLDCSGNQLTSLDVSKNTALTELDCQNNLLSNLDVSKNTALTRLFCSGNQLTSLDVSKDAALTELFCYRNRINEEAMTSLIGSLPIQEHAFLYAIKLDDDTEGNVCTVEQVKAAKEKGWIVKTAYGADYEGSDPAGIQDITFDKDIKTPIYDLNGRKLNGPRKGINIISSKKVIVK